MTIHNLRTLRVFTIFPALVLLLTVASFTKAQVATELTAQAPAPNYRSVPSGSRMRGLNPCGSPRRSPRDRPAPTARAYVPASCCEAGGLRVLRPLDT